MKSYIYYAVCIIIGLIVSSIIVVLAFGMTYVEPINYAFTVYINFLETIAMAIFK